MKKVPAVGKGANVSDDKTVCSVAAHTCVCVGVGVTTQRLEMYAVACFNMETIQNTDL